MTAPTFGSLFSGIGGLDLGLERAGWRCVWQSEVDDYASRVLKRHWPDVPNLGDIRTIDWSTVERPDLIAGGFPCQDISYAGRGDGLDGEQSGLWWEFARAIREVGPRYALVENVPALITRGLDAVLGTLATLGYDAEWGCLSAAALGAPHIRDRVFVVAHTNANSEYIRVQGCGTADSETRCVQKAPSQRQRIRAYAGTVCRALPDTTRNGRHAWRAGDAAESEKRRQPDRGGIGARIRAALRDYRSPWGPDPADGPEPSLGRVVDGCPDRVDRLRGLGNAVVPQVAELIGRAILEAHHAHRD